MTALRARFDGGTGPFDPTLVALAEACYADAAQRSDVVLLHGDLHHENVLAAGREPWLVIDPKGIVLTNHHVIEGASEIRLALGDGRGVVDGINMGVATCSSWKLWTVMPYMVNANLFYGNIQYMMNKAKFDALTAEEARLRIAAQLPQVKIHKAQVPVVGGAFLSFLRIELHIHHRPADLRLFHVLPVQGDRDFVGTFQSVADDHMTTSL